MRGSLIKPVFFWALLCTTSIVSAQDKGVASPSAMATDSQFARFAPRPKTSVTRIDYTIWDEALNYFVFRMGKSTREAAPSVQPGLNTRLVYGHDSRYRLEGSRVTFSFLSPEVIQSLSDYRMDLQETADQVDISSLARNEQLAYWINLHNVAVIEQIALAYPVKQVADIKLGDGQLPLDEAKFITVKGVAMSPRDIRTKIVFANWNDPRVIYGFFRGEIGGPSIQADAFDGENVGDLLTRSGVEFVNSLRGVQKRGSRADVSAIYNEARPYFFPSWPTDFTAHLRQYAEADVTKILDETSDIIATVYEADVSDLGKGGRDPSYGFVKTVDDNGQENALSTRIPGSIQRLLRERAQKVNKLIKRNELVGRVILLDIDLPGEGANDDEVD